jgi:hypothetical protein
MHEPTYLEFARNPHELEERLGAIPGRSGLKNVFIDEVQRLPSLLSTVQILIDARAGWRYWLTGSSARTLRHFFDVGVRNGLLAGFDVSADRIGNLFERRGRRRVRARAGPGGDRDQGVAHVGESDLRGLRTFAEFVGRRHRSAVFYLGEVRRRIGASTSCPGRRACERWGCENHREWRDRGDLPEFELA